ncbi:MAG TPA: STAS domain-containing protein [Gaiella sp.]|jgi:anti-sigma B factor antagonist|nr:STAS domain-containing protein [Gaiella sp.]
MEGANGLRGRRYEFGHGAVELVYDGEVTTVVVSGDLDLSTVGRVRLALESACEAPPAKLVVDLSAVDFVDSHGLQLLVSTHRRLAAESCSIVVLPPAEHVQRVFTLTGLDWFLHHEPAARAAASEGCD